MKYLLFSILSFIIISLSAQDDDIIRHSFGVGFGLNTCIPIEDNSKPDLGYSVGFEYNYHFSEKIYLHSGLSLSKYVFSQYNKANSITYETSSLTYLDIPIELSYRINSFSINAGISKSLMSETGMGADFNIGYIFNKTKTHKRIEIILPSIKYITELADMDGNTYLIIESKLLFSF